MSKKKKNPDFTVRLALPNESKLDRKLLKLIYLALGEASMCWDSPESAGEFQSQEAIKIGAKLKENIKDLIRNA